MTRFQLVFRQHGENDRSEYRYSNGVGGPHFNGKRILDGETYVVRGVEWLFRADNAGDSMARFVCTLVVEPADA